MIAEFVHHSPPSKVVFRPGACAQLGAELAEIGVCRPVVLSGRRTSQSAAYRHSVSSLEDFVTFTEIPEHSSVAAIGAVLELARRHRADGFVAVGGGSASDTAKVAALWLAEGGDLEAHATRFVPPDRLIVPELEAPKLPIAAVPCTASGAEATGGAGIRTPDGRKLIFSDVKLAARVIVLDPAANTAVPASVMLATGMNGIAHCVEALYSKLRTPITDALARHAIDLFLQALPRVAREPDSADRRGQLLAAAHLSGLVLVNSRTCLHHAICHAIGAVSGASHGGSNSVMLPHAMNFNHESVPQSLPVARVRDLQGELGVPTRLRDIGVPPESLGAIAKKVMGERGLYFNPRPVRDPDEIESLLQAAW
jgi:alcohol dehydrogenase class IV